MNIVMMGVQGAGKGTQAKILSEKTGLPHISVGDLFRANISQGTELGKRASEYTDKGLLVPDEIVIDMVKDRLQQEDAKGGFLLDGFPRNEVQLAALEYLNPVDLAVFLNLDDETAIQRLTSRSECPKCGIIYGKNKKPKVKGLCDKCGGPLKERTDDKDTDAIKQRLAAYHSSIKTMLEYYKWKKVLREINAGRDVQAIADDVLKVVEDAK